jgi:hypothetical protein
MRRVMMGVQTGQKAPVCAEAYPGPGAGMCRQCEALGDMGREEEEDTHGVDDCAPCLEGSRDSIDSIAVSAWGCLGCGRMRRGGRVCATRCCCCYCCYCWGSSILLPIRAGAGFTWVGSRLLMGQEVNWMGNPRRPVLTLTCSCAAPSCFYTSPSPSHRPTASYLLRHSLPPPTSPPSPLLLPRRRDRLNCGSRLGLRP